MRRSVMFGCALCAALLVPQTASSRLYYGFTVGVLRAPPPPAIRMFREPRTVLTGDAMVYMANDPALRLDGDLFRYGQYWFVYSKGYWYRARAHRGPYAVIDVLKVPRAIIGVPRKMWKHHPLAMAATKATTSGDVARVKTPRTSKAKGAEAGRGTSRPRVTSTTSRPEPKGRG